MPCPGELRVLCVVAELEDGARVSALFEVPLNISVHDISALALLKQGFMCSLGKSRAQATP